MLLNLRFWTKVLNFKKRGRQFSLSVLACFFIKFGFASGFNYESEINFSYSGGFAAKFIQIPEEKHKKYKVIIEKGGVFPRLSTEHVRYGKNSILVEVAGLKNGVISSSYIKNRSEIHIAKFVPLQKEHWIQFSVFFPKEFSQPDNWFLFFQAWQKKAGNPILSLGIDHAEKLSIAVRNDEYHKGRALILYKSNHKIMKGVWQDFVIYLKGSLEQKGALSVWQRINGDKACFVPLIERRGVKIGKSVYRDGKLIKNAHLDISLRVGIYRGGSGILHRLWFDGLKYNDIAFVKNLNICAKQERK